jgi:excisionase family DNA binding protein
VQNLKRQGIGPTGGVSPEFFDIQDLSVHLKIKVKTLYFLAEEDRIPHYRVGKLIRFKRSEIDAWMEGNKKGCVASEQVAMKALGPVRKPKIDIDRIDRKAIDGTRGQGYTTSHGKTRPQGPQEGGQ